MDKQDLRIKSARFAHECVKLAIDLPRNKLGTHIEGHLLRRATSLASNYCAAL